MRSTPTSRMTSIGVRVHARRLAARRSARATRSPKSLRARPSAIWLRAELATQRKRMLVGVVVGVHRRRPRRRRARRRARPRADASGKKRFCAQSATFTRPMSTGTSTSGPMTAAKAAPLWMPKRGDGDRDGELEVVRRGGERERRRLRVVGADALAHEERHHEHHDEVDEQRDRDAQHVERQLHDRLALEREHHDDGEEQRDERDRADARHEAASGTSRGPSRATSTRRVRKPAANGMPR